MNKYEIFTLAYAGYAVYMSDDFDDKNRTDRTDNRWSTIDEKELKIVVKQHEDYNITKYFLRFQMTVEKAIYNGKEYKQQSVGVSSNPSVVVPLDFDKKVKEITLCFDDVIDPIVVPIEFIDADKKAYGDKVDQQHQADLQSKAVIKISTGADLVNIYFQPCSDTYGKTEIELYLADGKYSQAPMVMGKHDVFHPQLLSATAGQMMGKFTVEEGMLFKSITGLAHHAYGVKVSQFDKEGKLLFKSDYIYFHIG